MASGVCGGLILAPAAWASSELSAVTAPDLGRLSIEELAQVEITSVSRRAESLDQAAAAVYVITADDIRRSGAPTLAEVLRLAPNLQVQRLNTADYAISARGFNGYETANKLLVLVDGRSIYSSLHSGVFWDTHTLPVETIERIEVISGPGGALYGANAVNGVINIITRNAADTQGAMVSAGLGDHDRTVVLRYGGRLGENGAWRAFVSALDQEASDFIGGGAGPDPTSGLRAGFRADWSAGADAFMLKGETFENEKVVVDAPGPPTVVNSGASVNGRWARALADGGELAVQAYFDRTERTGAGQTELVDTWDLHLQHSLTMGERHRIVWGGGYRWIRSEFEAPGSLSTLEPGQRDISLANLFVQDQIALREDLTLTLGLKAEHSSFSGTELLPSVRLAWRSTSGDLLWGAISRAVRTPNRIERDLILPGFLEPFDFQSETLVAYELGYRSNPTPDLSLSISAFYNEYGSLRTVSPTPVTLLPIGFTNHGEGETWGVEAWATYDLNDRWRLSAGLSTLREDFDPPPPVLDLTALISTGDDPSYQALLRSQMDLTDRLELDLRLRAVDELGGAPGYTEADVRIGYRLSDRLELAVNGFNLLDEDRVESSDASRRRGLGRSVFATLRVDF